MEEDNGNCKAADFWGRRTMSRSRLPSEPFPPALLYPDRLDGMSCGEGTTGARGAEGRGRTEPVFVEFNKPVAEMSREELRELGGQLFDGIQRERNALAAKPGPLS